MSPTSANELLRLEVEPRGNVIVARLIGSANMVNVANLQDDLFAIVDRNPRQIVLDLSQLAFINSVGLGGIIAAHVRSRRQNGAISIAAPSAEILELLRVTNLTRLFPVYDSVDAALAN
jgi:anti-anti-sigma factor